MSVLPVWGFSDSLGSVAENILTKGGSCAFPSMRYGHI